MCISHPLGGAEILGGCSHGNRGYLKTRSGKVALWLIASANQHAGEHDSKLRTTPCGG